MALFEGIRIGDLVGVGMDLEEVCYWDWAFRFQKPCQAQSLSVPVHQDISSLPADYHAPTMMIMD